MWEKVATLDGKALLKNLKKQVEKSDGAFNIATGFSEVYGLNDKEIEQLEQEFGKGVEKAFNAGGLLEITEELLKVAGKENYTVGEFLVVFKLVDATIRLQKELADCMENDKIHEVVEMAKGRLLLVKEELDNADIYILHVPKKNPFEEILSTIGPLTVIGFKGGGKE